MVRVVFIVEEYTYIMSVKLGLFDKKIVLVVTIQDMLENLGDIDANNAQ